SSDEKTSDSSPSPQHPPTLLSTDTPKPAQFLILIDRATHPQPQPSARYLAHPRSSLPYQSLAYTWLSDHFASKSLSLRSELPSIIVWDMSTPTLTGREWSIRISLRSTLDVLKTCLARVGLSATTL